MEDSEKHGLCRQFLHQLCEQFKNFHDKQIENESAPIVLSEQYSLMILRLIEQFDNLEDETESECLFTSRLVWSFIHSIEFSQATFIETQFKKWAQEYYLPLCEDPRDYMDGKNDEKFETSLLRFVLLKDFATVLECLSQYVGSSSLRNKQLMHMLESYPSPQASSDSVHYKMLVSEWKSRLSGIPHGADDEALTTAIAILDGNTSAIMKVANNSISYFLGSLFHTTPWLSISQLTGFAVSCYDVIEVDTPCDTAIKYAVQGQYSKVYEVLKQYYGEKSMWFVAHFTDLMHSYDPESKDTDERVEMQEIRDSYLYDYVDILDNENWDLAVSYCKFISDGLAKAKEILEDKHLNDEAILEKITKTWVCLEDRQYAASFYKQYARNMYESKTCIVTALHYYAKSDDFYQVIRIANEIMTEMLVDEHQPLEEEKLGLLRRTFSSHEGIQRKLQGLFDLYELCETLRKEERSPRPENSDKSTQDEAQDIVVMCCALLQSNTIPWTLHNKLLMVAVDNFKTYDEGNDDDIIPKRTQEVNKNHLYTLMQHLIAYKEKLLLTLGSKSSMENGWELDLERITEVLVESLAQSC